MFLLVKKRGLLYELDYFDLLSGLNFKVGTYYFNKMDCLS